MVFKAPAAPWRKVVRDGIVLETFEAVKLEDALDRWPGSMCGVERSAATLFPSLARGLLGGRLVVPGGRVVLGRFDHQQAMCRNVRDNRQVRVGWLGRVHQAGQAGEKLRPG